MNTRRYSKENVEGIEMMFAFQELSLENLRKHCLWAWEIHKANGQLLKTIYGKTFNDLYEAAIDFIDAYYAGKCLLADDYNELKEVYAKLKAEHDINKAALEGLKERMPESHRKM